MLVKQLTNTNPDLDDEGDELKDVDVTELAILVWDINVWLSKLGIVSVKLGEATSPEVFNG